ncbi:MAG: helix-turn-helix transcriptional regulator [Sphaerochaetaceae bacterium]|jgi:DNA-binding Xre family transcriptional regulator|nr:helix-turn-helix transcriptional regulator [Sphaerochaetaceae bacterium]
MYFNYNNLWKLLIDKKMNKQDLRKMTGISSASIAKLGKGENVNTEILLRICKVLECDISDIMEFVPDKDNQGEGTKITE